MKRKRRREKKKMNKRVNKSDSFEEDSHIECLKRIKVKVDKIFYVPEMGTCGLSVNRPWQRSYFACDTAFQIILKSVKKNKITVFLYFPS